MPTKHKQVFEEVEININETGYEEVQLSLSSLRNRGVRHKMRYDDYDGYILQVYGISGSHLEQIKKLLCATKLNLTKHEHNLLKELLATIVNNGDDEDHDTYIEILKKLEENNE